MYDIVETIQAIVAVERKGPARITDPSLVPSTYDAITPEWLTPHVCGSVAGAEVRSFSLGEADNGSCNRRRIYLVYNEAGQAAGLPASVFCKGALTPETRAMLADSGTVEAETNFYTKARPRLDLIAPETFYVGHNPAAYTYLIIMNDIGEETVFPDERHIVTRQQAENMVETLSRLHSRFYDSPELGTPMLPFRRWDEWWPSLVAGFPGFEACSDQALGESEHIMAPRLFKRRGEIWAKTMRSAQAHAALPSTLIHSDVHLKNWFIMPDDQMGLHDWQFTSIGHWSRDLIYSLTTALTIENRRAWLSDLIALYLEKMAARGVPRISQDDAMRNCRQQIMTALGLWTITLRPAPGMTEMQPEQTTWAFLERFYAAIDDYDALDAFD